MLDNFHTYNEYFASANGYSGFKSYFKEVFSSTDFERVYVLKGGPGTGKSSVIKRICAFCHEKKIYYEIYRCSSDISSLDGVIISDNNKKVAIVDGTSPHQRDAEIPGAIDELVNLGEAWDKSMIKSKRENIIRLNNEKHDHYAKAYKYLEFSSVFNTNIKAEIKSLFDFRRARTELKNISDKISYSRHKKSEVKLVSSFSKDGFKTLEGPFLNAKINYSIFGRYGSDKIFVGMLINSLTQENISFCRIPSPLDSSINEGILSTDGSGIIFGMGNGEVICDTTSYLKIKNIKDFEDKMCQLENSKQYYLHLASDEFKVASKYHFMLEDIYTSAMDFSIVEDYCDKIISEIKNIYLD